MKKTSRLYSEIISDLIDSKGEIHFDPEMTKLLLKLITDLEALNEDKDKIIENLIERMKESM